MSFANVFRPTRFDEVLGHERYVRAFRNLIEKDALPSCILLAGASGVGKTTLARILAAAATCSSDQRPCGECQNCRAAQGINDGPNFMHMDGAGSQLKEKVEGDLKNFIYSAPLGRSRYKVCIADEAQEISKGATGALLTMTENMPPRSIFIMTTMDPEAIHYAILSRSFKAYLGGLPPETMVEGVLKHRPDLEEARKGLLLLAEASRGCMREMWQLVEKYESFDEELTENLAAWMTGAADKQTRQVLWEAIEGRNFKGITQQWDQLILKGASPDRLGNQLLEDLIQRAAEDPTSRDWTQPIRYLSQASVLRTEAGWRAALCSIVPSPDLPSQQLDTERTIDRIVEKLQVKLSTEKPARPVIDLSNEEEVYKLLYGREPEELIL